jgi:DNA polymerase-3 subunit delta'
MSLLAHPATEKNIKDFLSRPSHGLLLVGPKESGKSHVAKYIGAKLIGTTQGNLNIHPYFKSIDASEAKASIDDIRELKKFLSLKTAGKQELRRLALVQNVEELRHEAQNAMLKLLEEPPSDTVIILTTSDGNKLRQTIRSRLQKIEIRGLTLNQIEEIEADSDKALRLYNLSEGLPALLTALQRGDDNYPSTHYIQQAKQILSQPRHQRLIYLEKNILKDDEFDIQALLDCFYKILRMKLKLVSDVESVASRQTISLYSKINQVLYTQKLISQNVHPKIALTRLFYML